ncbi:helix-turn-helix domain-containing protein [Planosporangium flavigriseum]|uniref:Transposase putative helix-turn-helix domain-containing protein n=2 Tax=Planosporangium flavigriseum TaxID=373681 RepID=A0A8J3PLY2_9ACTN|nr:helix-turn-helix domain-containing protein [Planosporangium flavigriseum]GIG73729.1 hypothetical protein Pfl04_21330 [Planosporangium flavigriseum]
MVAVQAYRFALDLTPAQERAAWAHAGAARVAHNWSLARLGRLKLHEPCTWKCVMKGNGRT